MIEGDPNQPLQKTQMESAELLAEAVEKATNLGFTLAADGSTVDVLPWRGKPLIDAMVTDAIFEAQYLTELLCWLDGVAYGRANVMGETR